MLNPIPTMLTIDETANHFKLPNHFCRQAVLNGKVVHVKAGRKYLINAERFAEWLNTGDVEEAEPASNKIRRLY